MASLSDIERVVERLFGPHAEPDLDAARRISEAESRLGRPVPRVLREFGLRFGWQGRLARACETLLAPDAWRLQGGALVFCVENQGVVVWGLRRADLAQEREKELRPLFTSFSFPNARLFAVEWFDMAAYRQARKAEAAGTAGSFICWRSPDADQGATADGGACGETYGE